MLINITLKFLIFSKYNLIIYNEKSIFVSLKEERRELISSKSNFIFRKVLLRDNTLTILINHKSYCKENKIIQYEIEDSIENLFK